MAGRGGKGVSHTGRGGRGGGRGGRGAGRADGSGVPPFRSSQGLALPGSGQTQVLAPPVSLPHWPEFANIPEPSALETDDQFLSRKSAHLRSFWNDSPFYSDGKGKGEAAKKRKLLTENYFGSSFRDYFPDELLVTRTRKAKRKKTVPISEENAEGVVLTKEDLERLAASEGVAADDSEGSDRSDEDEEEEEEDEDENDFDVQDVFDDDDDGNAASDDDLGNDGIL
mmetsp:Transcript_2476/g.3303  ORF Transcript_2476/g.3303 Transcript_2476/m.3303 type:complete len:226 (+) Transcript_2476:46-723(+)